MMKPRNIGISLLAATLAIVWFATREPRDTASSTVAPLPDASAFNLSDFATGQGAFEALNTIPMFTIEAIDFLAVDESGIDFLGSDEVIALWVARGAPSANTFEFGDVDTFERRAFHEFQSCVYPIATDWFHIDGTRPHPGGEDGTRAGWDCVRGGGPGPLNFVFSLYETDSDWEALLSPPYEFDTSVGTGISDVDDLIGHASFNYSVAELLELMPDVGDVHTVNDHTVVHCAIGEVCGSWEWADHFINGEYTVSFRIIRMEDVEVPQVFVDE